MSKTRLVSGLSVLVLPLLLVAGAAQAEEQNQGDDKGEMTDEARAVERLELADRLAAYGIEVNDPMMLIQAARIKQAVPTEELDIEPEQEGEGGEQADKEDGVDLSAEALLDRAQALAGNDDEHLVAMIEQAREGVSTRGRVPGAVRHTDIVNAGTTDVYSGVRFRGNEHAIVTIAGDGDTDLDLHIYDENGNEICSSISYSDRERCSWTPRWTGPFRIEVSNLGSVWNAYTLTTN